MTCFLANPSFHRKHIQRDISEEAWSEKVLIIDGGKAQKTNTKENKVAQTHAVQCHMIKGHDKHTWPHSLQVSNIWCISLGLPQLR